jgi:hypothetical protein
MIAPSSFGAFIAFSIFGVVSIVFLVSYARSMLKNGIMGPNGKWTSPDAPGFRKKIKIAVFIICFAGMILVAIGLMGAFAPQVLIWAVATVEGHY